MTAGAAHVWLPGFFTGRRHAVLDVHHGMTFHGVRLVWSVCGRAAVVDPGQSGGGPCDRCVFLAGPPDPCRIFVGVADDRIVEIELPPQAG